MIQQPNQTGAPASLHQRIRTDLEQKILSGEWPPGFQIPFEHALMVHYRCARMTVNKAISALVAAGLITRRRHAGSFVAQPPIQSAVLHIPDLQAEIIAQGKNYGYELLARQRRARPDATSVDPDFRIDTPVLVLKSRHLANSAPFALEHRLINLAAVPEAETTDFTRTPPGAWLLAQVPWTRAAHQISAINATAPLATALAIPIGTACIMVERRTWRVTTPITYVRQIFPGKTYRLTAYFTPSRPQTP